MSESEAPASPPDPWKGLRGVMAGTLILEAIVVLLALPVIAVDGVSWISGTYVVTLAVLMFAGAALQRRPWAIPYNLALQVAFVLGIFVHIAIGVLGILFSFVWAYTLYLRRDLKMREARGMLPSQQSAPPESA